MQLEESFFETDRMTWRRWLPWLALFRSFRLALDLRMIGLGLLGALLIVLGMFLISLMPIAHEGYETAVRRQFQFVRGIEPFPPPAEWLPWLAEKAQMLAEPWRDIFGAIRVWAKGQASWANVAMVWSQLLWNLLVWSFVGVAMTRIAALNFADRRDARGRGALKQTSTLFLGTLAAPLLPLMTIVLFWGCNALAGLIARIPEVGPVLVGLFLFIPIVLAVLMVLLLIGTAVGWPLMIATMGVEGTDAFDALSRAFSYLFGRPWYALFLIIVSALYGGAILIVVDVFLDAVIRMTTVTIQTGGGEAATFLSGWLAPESVSNEDGAGFWAATLWRQALGLAETGFRVGLFWSLATIVYLLLRKSDDAVELTEVFVPETGSEPDDLLPLVGMAAAERREERETAEPQTPTDATDFPQPEAMPPSESDRSGTEDEPRSDT